MSGLEFRLVAQAGESATWSVQIPADLVYLQGHFPGHPLLPGVAQLLAMALDRTHALWPALGQPRRITQLKFKRPIYPGDQLLLRLERAGHEVRFSLERGADECTRGALIFA